MSEQAVRVSYILPTRNRARYLADVLKNVREFITPLDELIVMDGGSTDDTRDVVEKNKDIVSVFVSEPDAGEAHALNKGVLLSRGRYIKQLTDDDYWYPDAMHEALAFLDGHAEIDALICAGEYFAVDPATGVSSFVSSLQLPPGGTFSTFADCMPVICGAGLFLHRRAIARVGLFATTFRAIDVEYTARLFSAGARFHYVPIKLYRWTHYPHSGASFDRQVCRDWARTLLAAGRWDLLLYLDEQGFADAVGLAQLPGGTTFAELILHADRVRRTPLRLAFYPFVWLMRQTRRLARFAAHAPRTSSPTSTESHLAQGN